MYSHRRNTLLSELRLQNKEIYKSGKGLSRFKLLAEKIPKIFRCNCKPFWSTIFMSVRKT